MAGTGIHSFLAFRAQISAECHKPHDRLKPLAFRAQTYCGMQTPWYNLTAECHKPRDHLQPLAFRGTHLNAELGKRLNSSSSHFTSRATLFELSYLVVA
jgi:hypothetical protein